MKMWLVTTSKGSIPAFLNNKYGKPTLTLCPSREDAIRTAESMNYEFGNFYSVQEVDISISYEKQVVPTEKVTIY